MSDMTAPLTSAEVEQFAKLSAELDGGDITFYPTADDVAIVKRVLRALTAAPIDGAAIPREDSEMIKTAVDKFLAWKLPDTFRPDCGISFKADYNENTPWPAKHEPCGTNLFTADEARAMFEHCLADALSAAPTVALVELGKRELCGKPPFGWVCSRGSGHDGPCAASRDTAQNEFHLLRILGNGQISASRARELLAQIRDGDAVDLPPFEQNDCALDRATTPTVAPGDRFRCARIPISAMSVGRACHGPIAYRGRVPSKGYLGGDISIGEKYKLRDKYLVKLPRIKGTWKEQCFCGTTDRVMFRRRLYCPTCARRIRPKP